MFKTKDILLSLNKEKMKLESKITPDYIAEELSHVILGNGIINFKKEDIEKIFCGLSSVEYNILINTDTNSKLSYIDIFEDKNLENIKNLIFVIKHNGSLTLFRIYEFLEEIKASLPNTNIEILLGDYIDKDTNEIKITTLLVK